MGGSRMGGSRMGGSRMGGSKMGGSRIETIEGSRMVGVGGSRIGGSIVPTQGSMVLRTQQEFGALHPSILGNPSKTIVNEDEISIEGERFVEKKTLKNDGNQTYLTHSVQQYTKLLQLCKMVCLYNSMQILILRARRIYLIWKTCGLNC